MKAFYKIFFCLDLIFTEESQLAMYQFLLALSDFLNFGAYWLHPFFYFDLDFFVQNYYSLTGDSFNC